MRTPSLVLSNEHVGICACAQAKKQGAGVTIVDIRLLLLLETPIGQTMMTQSPFDSGG